MSVLDKYAPLELSQLMISRGSYDNSGLLVKSSDKSDKVLFSLDLSIETVKNATVLGCDTIVTHHPAIYTPIKKLDIDGETKALTLAVQNKLNVVSMHLNLDVASGGIDECLAKALGAKDFKILDELGDEQGYGREFICKKNIDVFVDQIKSVFNTDKILVYGTGECNVVASFCGGGASHAVEAVLGLQTCADTIVTSDVAHHEIKEIVEKGIKLVVIPHYVAEDYGFKEYYLKVKQELNGLAETCYFQDKRFV